MTASPQKEGLPKRISELLHDKHIFITGTTGFVGQLVLEKLMRHFPNVRKLSLLIRDLEDIPAKKRFGQIIRKRVFIPLKNKMGPDFEAFCRKKVNVVRGDISKFRYGMSPNEYQSLRDDPIDLILNVAATVKFYDLIDNSLQTNALFATYNAATLSKEHQDAPIVHVSTCYVNGFNTGKILEEPMGQPPLTSLLKVDLKNENTIPELMIKMILESDKVRSATPDEKALKSSLIDLGTKTARQYGWNDIYSFTKWLGEMKLIWLMGKKNLTILRPSVIESTYLDPIPGYIEGIKVTDLLLVAYVMGKLKLFCANLDKIIDIIPGDHVANSIILSIQHALTQRDRLEIFQCCSGAANPITFGRYQQYCLDAIHNRHPDIFKLVKRKFTNRKIIWVSKDTLGRILQMQGMYLKTLKRVNHALPLFDFSTKIAKMQKAHQQAETFFKLFALYSCPEYIFQSEKLNQAFSALHPEDQTLFPVSPAGMDWQSYVENHIEGLKQVIQEENIH